MTIFAVNNATDANTKVLLKLSGEALDDRQYGID
jgi:hypothetical protein